MRTCRHGCCCTLNLMLHVASDVCAAGCPQALLKAAASFFKRLMWGLRSQHHLSGVCVV